MNTHEILAELEHVDLLVMTNEPTITERRIQHEIRLLREIIERMITVTAPS